MIELLAKLTVLLVVVGLARLAASRVSAAAGHLTLVAGLACAVLLPLAMFAAPAWDLVVPGASFDLVPTAETVGVAAVAPIGPPDPAAGSPKHYRLADVPRRAPGAAARPTIPWIALLWVAGFAFVFSRAVFGWVRMARISRGVEAVDDPRLLELVECCRERLDLRIRPSLAVSERVDVPFVWGVARPRIFLPANAVSWSAERLRVVLLHEMAHLRRRDVLAIWIGRLCAALYWFHPLSWVLERSARREAERACDDVVLSCGERASDYAGHLVAIARDLTAPRPSRAGTLALVRRSRLEHRVRDILRPGTRRDTGARMIATTMTAAFALVAVIGGARVVAADAEPNEFFIAQLQHSDRVEHVDKDHDEGAEAFEEAYEHHGDERFDEAIRLFTEAYEVGFRRSTAAYNAACGHAKLGRANAALEWLEKAMEAGWDDFDYFYEDSDLDPIRSDAEFRELLERIGGEVDAHEWHEIGTELLMTRRLDRAVEALERAVEHSDGDDTSLYNLACALSLNGTTSVALDRLEQAVLNGFDSRERFENDSDLDPLRGEARFDEIAALNEFLSMDRFRHERGLFAGDSEYSKTRWEGAITEYADYVDRNPNVGRAWFNLGWVSHFSYRHAEAAAAFARAAELGFREPTAIYNVACAQAMAGRTDAALDALEQAVELGFVSADHIAEDDDLESLRDNPRFERILEEAEAKSGHHGNHWKWLKRMMKSVDPR